MMTAHPPGPLRHRWLLYGSAATGLAVLLSLYRILDEVAAGRPAKPLEPLLTEFTGVFGAALLLPFAIRFIRRRPLERGTWLRRIPAYLGVTVAFGFLHTSWMWGSRSVLFPLAGLGAYDYGTMPARYLMEFPIQLVGAVLTIAFVHVLDRYRAAREREVRTSQLEASLARAQLQALQAQLQPHFLFNALNTISSTMYEDLDAADRMIGRLSDLLRHALRTLRTPSIPLEEEFAILEPYAELMRARFGERLSIELLLDPAAADVAVPALLLQPLVENAAEHGVPEPPLPALVRVSARREGDRLVLAVEDNGPGAPLGEPLLGRGIGLTNTAERLRAHFGAAARIVWDNLPYGGFRVVVEIPYEPAAPVTVTEASRWTPAAS